MATSPSLIEPSETARLLDRAAAGNQAALDELLDRHRDYVRRIVDMRIDPAVQARVDASDVVQETLMAASRRMDEFIKHRPATFRVWLRGQALDRLIDAHRRNVCQKRDVRRDVSVNDASSMAILGGIAAGPPSELLMRRELLEQIREALAALNECDRDILLMRHAEQLSNSEAAEVLAITEAAASKRYGRAVLRLAAELRRRGITGGA